MKLSFAALLLCSTWVFPLYAETLRGKVVGVSDGDTITVLDADKIQYKVRLAGIDAPENSQAFGERSKQHLGNLVFGKVVSVEWNKTDKYGRIVGKVLVNDQDANLRQVSAGLAWHYKQYEKEQSLADRMSYAQAEADARTRKAGLWFDAAPVPPWEFRHRDIANSTAPREAPAKNCPCNTTSFCTGPRGGHYCITITGNKKYI